MKKILLVIVIAALALPVLAQAPPSKVAPRLERILADPALPLQQADGTWAVWVYFQDKDLQGAALEAALDAAARDLPERTRSRRAKVDYAGGRLVDGGDLPVAPRYLDGVEATGADPRRESRWLNAASFDATREQIAAIAGLPFVTKVDVVAKFRRSEPEVSAADEAADEEAVERAKAAAVDRWSLDYGGSTAGLEQINVPPVHELGLSGNGVVVGMLDSGYRTTHVALQGVDILATWDFVNDDPIVDEEPGDPLYSARHGTQTLSTIMGFLNGELVGPAYQASVILAKTEDYGDEYPQEEDFWVAGLEWVESLGADLVSSSLGYFYWYDFVDLDGNTAVTTIAADLAVGRGLGVYTSAGNERDNADHPHITAPADGDSVVAMAAVTLAGDIADFSSPGPTFDGRIKPDLSAQGVGNWVASYYDDASYHTANGTSFACPLVAGVAALMLERVPSLTPMQIREALRATADRAANPDNDYGWGIIDAYAAATYWGPAIVHEALTDTEDNTGPYIVTATITSRVALDPSSLFLFWRADAGPWQSVALAAQGGDIYTADIPGQPNGTEIDYYLEAADVSGITIALPHGAPAAFMSFRIDVDVVAPTLFHASITAQVPVHWPPVVVAEAEDVSGIDRVELVYQHNGGAPQGPFTLTFDGEVYTRNFPLAAGSVTVGDEITYEITAYDLAATPNTSVSGPHMFEVVADLGSVLVIDNDAFGSNADLIVQWLNDAGYQADLVDDDALTSVDLAGRDAAVLTCGNNQLALSSDVLRNTVRNWVEAGGRILVEGGETAIVSYDGNIPYDPQFATRVLHISEWWGDGYDTTINLQPLAGQTTHAFRYRPHRLPEIVPVTVIGYDFGGFDYALAAADALPILRVQANAGVGGVVIHDDNTGYEAGQNVYFTFALQYVEPTLARELVENALAYLTTREAPGAASISGNINLYGTDDNSGVTVSVGPYNSAVTGPDGNYTLAGLHGGTYTVTATKDGYGPDELQVSLAIDEHVTGVNFTLYEVIEIHASVAPDLPIPDNDPNGITSVITIAESGALFDINVDMDITHASTGNLLVTLTSPEGTTVTLHNHTGGTADDIVGNYPLTLTVDGPGSLLDFAGEEVQGDWTLFVADTQFAAWGNLNAWGLNLLALVDPPIAVQDDDLPTVTRLAGNAPNPFNPMTTIRFELAAPGPVQLDVFDLRGLHVRRLVSGDHAAGRHEVNWDGRDTGGRETASGVYFCRLQTGGGTDLHKITLVR